MRSEGLLARASTASRLAGPRHGVDAGFAGRVGRLTSRSWAGCCRECAALQAVRCASGFVVTCEMAAQISGCWDTCKVHEAGRRCPRTGDGPWREGLGCMAAAGRSFSWCKVISAPQPLPAQAKAAACSLPAVPGNGWASAAAPFAPCPALHAWQPAGVLPMLALQGPLHLQLRPLGEEAAPRLRWHPRQVAQRARARQRRLGCPNPLRLLPPAAACRRP